MKKIFNTMILAAVLFGAVACEKASLGVTRITYYAQLEVLGDASVVVQKGSTYVDEGCVATLQGEDVTSQVVVTSNVNTQVSGIYSVNYSITNSDGFEKTASRKVTVLDFNDPIEGFYTTLYVSVNGSTTYNGPHSTLLIGQGNGIYSSTDLLGGWYDQGRGYGSNYAMTGTIKVDGTDITLIDSYIAGWGDGLDPFFVGVYDAEEGTLSWETSYAGMPCFITIKKN